MDVAEIDLDIDFSEKNVTEKDHGQDVLERSADSETPIGSRL